MRDRLPELPPLHDVRAARMLRELGGERLGVDPLGDFEAAFADTFFAGLNPVISRKHARPRAAQGVR
jgi:hypothetical protein